MYHHHATSSWWCICRETTQHTDCLRRLSRIIFPLSGTDQAGTAQELGSFRLAVELHWPDAIATHVSSPLPASAIAMWVMLGSSRMLLNTGSPSMACTISGTKLLFM